MKKVEELFESKKYFLIVLDEVLHAVEDAFVDPGDQKITLLFEDLPRYPQDLNVGFSFAVDDFRESAPQLSVMVDPGKLQVFIWKILEIFISLFGRELAVMDLFQNFFESGFHGVILSNPARIARWTWGSQLIYTESCLDMEYKTTIKNKIHFSGIGVHTGTQVEMKLVPSSSGIVSFRRLDLDRGEVILDHQSVRAQSCTTLVLELGQIQTVEHLLAALYAAEIDSVVIELDGAEVPILDGSAKDFSEAIAEVGRKVLKEKREVLNVVREFHVRDGEAEVRVSPDSCFRVTYLIDYAHPAIGHQELNLEISPEVFVEEIAPARTFGFLKDVPAMQERGLARGGSLENALVLDETGVINGPLRFPDEFVRHKVLDLIGDLSLLGAPVKGHFRAQRAGHLLHHRAVCYLLDNPELYRID